jgi:hypothetical protein
MASLRLCRFLFFKKICTHLGLRLRLTAHLSSAVLLLLVSSLFDFEECSWILNWSSVEGPSLGTEIVSQRFRVGFSMDGARICKLSCVSLIFMLSYSRRPWYIWTTVTLSTWSLKVFSSSDQMDSSAASVVYGLLLAVAFNSSRLALNSSTLAFVSLTVLI